MRVILAAASALILAGCMTPYDLGRRENGDPLSYTNKPRKITQIDPALITANTPTLSSTESKELAGTLLDRSDVYCQNYLVGVSVINNTAATSLDITALTLSSVAPLTTPARNKNILSAISAIATGSKSALINDVLGGKDYGLIHDAIVAGRKDERKLIQQDIDADKFKGWSQDAILAHMQPYHVDCGIEFGLQYLRAVVTKQSQTTGSTPSPADTASATSAKAKTAADQAAAKSTQAATATLDAAGKTKDATAKASAVAAASPADKPKAVNDAATAKIAADQAQTLADAIKKAEAAAKVAADDWADAAAKADATAKAYAVAEAATALSDTAAKDAETHAKALPKTKAPT